MIKTIACDWSPIAKNIYRVTSPFTVRFRDNFRRTSEYIFAKPWFGCWLDLSCVPRFFERCRAFAAFTGGHDISCSSSWEDHYVGQSLSWCRGLVWFSWFGCRMTSLCWMHTNLSVKRSNTQRHVFARAVTLCVSYVWRCTWFGLFIYGGDHRRVSSPKPGFSSWKPLRVTTVSSTKSRTKTGSTDYVTTFGITKKLSWLAGLQEELVVNLGAAHCFDRPQSSFAQRQESNFSFRQEPSLWPFTRASLSLREDREFIHSLVQEIDAVLQFAPSIMKYMSTRSWSLLWPEVARRFWIAFIVSCSRMTLNFSATFASDIRSGIPTHHSFLQGATPRAP